MLLALLALLVPTVAAAKYEGSREQRTPITVAIVFEGASSTQVRAALETARTERWGRRAFDFDASLGGSEVVLVAYDLGARVVARTAFTDATTLPPLTGGSGPNLPAGIETGLAVLARSTTDRRALIVIGDGPDIYERARSFRTRVYEIADPRELLATFERIAEQPPVERTTSRTPTEPLPWKGFGVLAFAVVAFSGVQLARPPRAAG